MNSLRGYVSLLVLLCLAASLKAQTVPAPPAVTYSNQVPTFGAGHDYIQMLGETVNPANGSVSLRINLPLPSARGLQPPFNLSYDSAGMYGIQPLGEPNFNLVTSHLSLGLQPSTNTLLVQGSAVNGWAISMPSLQATRLKYEPAYTYNTQLQAECPYTQGFVFTDMSGGKHAFDTIVYSYPEGDSNATCSDGSNPVNVFSTDGLYHASIIPDAAVSIVQADGTTYYFNSPVANVAGIVNGQGTGTTYPYRIEDRNGNRIDGSNVGVWSYALTDTLNRSVLTVTDRANNAGEDSTKTIINVASLPSPFKLQWATTNVSSTQGLPSSVVTTVGYNCTTAPRPGSSSQGPFALNLPASLTLPNNTAYSFEYDAQYGLLNKITYPNGSYVSYEWGLPGTMSDQADYMWSTGSQGTAQDYSVSYSPNYCSIQYQLPVLTKRTVSFDGTNVALKQEFSYTTAMLPVSAGGYTRWSSKTTTVLTTDLLAGRSYTKVYSYVPSGQMSANSVTLGPGPSDFHGAGSPAVEASVVTKEGANVLQTASKTWLDPQHILSSKIAMEDGATTETDTTYTGYVPQVYETKVYDFGANAHGTLLRKTVTDYASFGQTPIFPGDAGYQGEPTLSSMFSFPSKTSVYDGLGNLVAETDYGYDEAAVSGVTATQHDDQNYGAGSTAPRANLTSITRKCFPSCSDTKTTMTYDTTGQALTVKDPNGQTSGAKTVLSYTDDFYPGSGSSAAATNAYLTSITSPTVNGVTASISAKFGFNDGRLHSVQDANGKTTTYCYATGGCTGGVNDPWLRLTGISDPSGGGATASFVDTGVNPTTTISTKLNLSRSMSQVLQFDSFGHLIQKQSTSDPLGTTYSDTTYDGEGRVRSVSNPYRTQGDSTNGVTTTTYDALGRKKSIANSDGTALGWTYAGNTVTFTDEALHSWSQTLDALGRITQVSEPGGLKTTYMYDALGNLLTADQWGTSTVGSAGGGSRSRSFTYDSLSRLITSKNPETGTICYGRWSGGSVGSGTCQNGYDASGNLLAKTDARGMGTVYTYDALNRLKTKAYFGPGYQDGAVKTYYYDGSRADGGPSGTGLTQVGRLSSARSWAPFGNGLHDEYQSYDAMGRVTGRTEVAQSESGTGGHSIGMAYDLAGNLTSLTYPDGRVVTQGYDSAGRLNSVTDGNGQKYVSSVSYFPNGTPQQMVFSNDNMSEYTSLNSRLQVCETKIGNGGGPGTLFDRQYFYGSDTTSGNQCNDVTNNNGNLMHVLDSMNSTNSQHYTYDSLNRLTHWNGFSPAGTVRQQSFGYDSFGNMAPAASATAPSVTGLFDANNRLVAQTTSDCLSYDAAGNLTCTGTQNTDAHNYGFNEESELVLAWVAQNSTSNLVGQYSFDSSGTRVRSDNPTAHTWREYTYLNGQVLAEKDNTGNWTDHIYENGKHLAMVQSSVPELHIHGQRDAQHVNMGCGTNWWTDGMGGPGYTVRSGDRWFFRHKNAGAVAGMQLQLTDGSFGWQHGLVDQNGVGVELLGDTGGAFATRVIDLNPIAGMTIARTLVDINNQTPAGTYDVFYREASIVSADGTMTPIFNGQAVPGSIWDGCGVYNRSFGVEPTTATGAEAATYYAGDQVGTVQMEFSSAAWPVARHEFAPFGQQLDTQPTQNRYKFTGKERDTESGLDYFGARYYNSNAGRFMSPDWAAQAETVPYAKMDDPQSLNLYAYVRNNPLNRTDPNGHSVRMFGSFNVPQVGDFNTGDNAPPSPDLPAAVLTGMGAYADNYDGAQQQNGNNADSVAPEGQTPSERPASWKPGDPFPTDPSGLGPDWVHDPSHRAPNDEHWINPGTGDKVEWHPGIPGKPGEMGKDHWHWLPGGVKEKPHYDPGDRIKTFWTENKGAILATGAVVVVGGAIALAPFTGGASLGALALVP